MLDRKHLRLRPNWPRKHLYLHILQESYLMYIPCVLARKLPFLIAKTFASALAYVVRELFHVDVVCPNCSCCYMCWRDYTIPQKVCMHCITWQNISKQNNISSLFSHHCALCVQEKGGLVVGMIMDEKDRMLVFFQSGMASQIQITVCVS